MTNQFGRPQPDTAEALRHADDLSVAARLADLAEGLIEGCIAHFGEEVAVRREDLEGGNSEVVRFELVATVRQNAD